MAMKGNNAGGFEIVMVFLAGAVFTGAVFMICLEEVALYGDDLVCGPQYEAMRPVAYDSPRSWGTAL